MINEKIVIVDGNSLINRAYFAMPDLRNGEGIYVGGIHGLISMIMSLIDQFKPTHFAVAFDLKGPTFRTLVYEAYKGTRKGMPEELAMQMPIVKELLDAMGIPRIEFQGYEADDLIGTIAGRFSEEGIHSHIITGDKDALQLINETTHVHITKKGISHLVEYTKDSVFEELGIWPDQVIDYKGLSGDASDNIPGIPGVGPKTAAKLLDAFKTLENLILNSDEIENKRIKELVNTFSDQALLSKRLATIFKSVPIEMQTRDFLLVETDVNSVVSLLKKYELAQILTKFKSLNPVPTAKQPVEMESITYISIDELERRATEQGSFVFKIFYDKNDLTKKGHYAFFINNTPFILDNVEDELRLKPLFEDEKITKTSFDIKSDYLYLMKRNIDLKGVVFDGYIAAYLLEPSRKTYTLSEIVYKYSQITIPSEEDFFGKGSKSKSVNAIDLENLHLYMTQCIKAIAVAEESLHPLIIEKDAKYLFEEVEIPLIKVLSDIEYTGFQVDLETLNQLDLQLSEMINEIEKTVYDLAGEPFNINSPKQLGVILFEKLGLPTDKKTKTGYSTGHDVLEKLVNKHPVVEEIMSYRVYTKLKSTYIDGLRNVIAKGDNRVHTSLNQTVTVTGRLSSTEPNLQNIPVKLPYGRKIRKIFTANDGCVLLDADYSQIELRVLAHLSGDPRLIQAFNEGLDIHTITASQVFGIQESEVSSIQRSRAKEVNFGIVYGMGDFGLSESLNISRKEAKAYIENYFKSYPNVQGFMDGVIETCKEKGFVETILNRRRDVPDIDHKNFMLRSAAERIARNTPIQGSAADIIKLAMIKVYNRLIEKKLSSKIILQVHDELILNVPHHELEEVKVLLKDCMESAYALSVPLKVDMNTGVNWYESK